jgi:hypothetical protein
MNKSDFGKLMRKVGLVILIFFDIAATAWCFYWAKNTLDPDFALKWWSHFWHMIGLNVIVIGGEIGSVIFTGKTLSTNIKHLTQHKKEGWKGWVFNLFFFGALFGLLIHWVFVF